MRYAVVNDGLVANIAVSNQPLTAGWIAIPAGCPVAIGDTYADGVFYAPDGQMRMTADAEKLMRRIAELEAAVKKGADAR